jgi:hypothetical protein
VRGTPRGRRESRIVIQLGSAHGPAGNAPVTAASLNSRQVVGYHSDDDVCLRAVGLGRIGRGRMKSPPFERMYAEAVDVWSVVDAQTDGTA